MSQKPLRALLAPAAIFASLFTAVLMAAGGGAIALPDQGAAPASDGVFAVVDGEQIGATEFRSFLLQYARSKFYHGVTQQNLVEIREEAAEALINRKLLAREADRRGVTGDREAVERTLAGYETRYKDSESWPEIRRQWPGLRRQLLEQTKVAMLEDTIRQVDDPGDAVLKAYYEQNLDLFTEPERNRLSVILIGVDPSADAPTWREALEKSENLSAELKAGADFEGLARQHSTHVSAQAGGDLGVIHNGTLSQPAQEAVDQLTVGRITPPVRVLEGYALFWLQDRLLPRVRDFADVRERILALYKREKADSQWSGFVAALREQASIVVGGAADLGKRE